MTAIERVENLPPTAHVTMVYQGPTAPHWELQSHFGDQKLIDAFWTRVYARLLLLPKHDPQFRRNRERVNRDAEREGIVCDWNLGEGDAETTKTVVQNPADVVEDDVVEEGDSESLDAVEGDDAVEGVDELNVEAAGDLPEDSAGSDEEE